MPEHAGAPPRIAVIVERLHIIRVEAETFRLRIVRIDRGQIELPVLALRVQIGIEQRAARIRVHRRLEGARDDRQRPRRHELEVGRELPVDHHIDLRARVPREQRGAGHQHGVGDDQHVVRDAAVNVHLGESPPLRLDVDEHRREHAGDARRCGHHVAKQFERPGGAAGGDRAHVPDCGALRVDIRCHDVEAAAGTMLLGDGGEHVGVHVPRDQVAQRGGLEHAGAEDRRERIGLQEVGHLAAGEHAPDHLVVRRTEEGERRKQSAGAGAGHDGELRPRPAGRPAVQEAGSERAVGATARQGQDGRLPAGMARDHWIPLLPADLRVVGPDARPRDTGNRSEGSLLLGVRDARDGCAARQHNGAGCSHNPDGASHQSREGRLGPHLADGKPPETH